jgi:transcriptional regulator GlxA family with amidase domain
VVLWGSPALDYEVTVCAQRPGNLRTSAGYEIAVHRGLRAFASADTVVLPSWDRSRPVPEDITRAVRRARGARIIGLCVGAFVVAAAGIADGRDITTHWGAAAQLAAEYPNVNVRSDVLWTDHGDVVTSAGTAASLDCCLQVVRQDRGAAVAAELARRLVMPPHRTGSQAQFVPVPLPASDDHDAIAEAMVWARNRLGEVIGLDQWARSAAMSRRTFTRRFAERTGTSPGRWLQQQRLDHARVLLETTDLPIDQIAVIGGFGSAPTLRRQFAQTLGVSPRRHREQFAAAGA